ncbi:APC family permease [Candidatus Dependentiae bacterium]|nr:APC family permease [Candidatus Dependentiae bacterium]
MKRHTISLQSAILMNINIMAGAGIFINIFDLTEKLSIFGGLLYAIVGCFMFPLIFTFAQLVEKFPSGGFYEYGKQIHPFLGFLSGWTYFFGKLASVTVYMNVVTTFLRKLFPNPFDTINPMLVSLSILAFYILLNCLNMKTGLIIQKIFVTSKIFPLMGLILLGTYHFNINLLSAYPFDIPYQNFIFMLPLVLYCFSGFEAACSVSRNIENSSKNAPKAIFYSFFTVMLIYVIFQTLTGLMLKPNIINLSSYSDSYQYLMSLVPAGEFLQSKLITAISFLIGLSAMGAAYGILFSNSWNLYALAEHKHIIASDKLTTFNKYSIPYMAVLIEGFICAVYLWITGGNKIPLQQISTLGGTITYTISTIAFLYTTQKSKILGWLSLLTCLGLISSCIISTIQYNITSLYLFGIMLLIGISMFTITHKKVSQNNINL